MIIRVKRELKLQKKSIVDEHKIFIHYTFDTNNAFKMYQVSE